MSVIELPASDPGFLPGFQLSPKGYLLSTTRDCPAISGNKFAGRHFFKAWVMRYPRARA